MVVSASELASNVGVEILKKGGNAVDAAVAVGFALAVTFPSAGNLGGGGFMLIRLTDSENVVIDFREKAPLAAYTKMYLDSAGNYNPLSSQTGWKSAGVPGTVAGLSLAHIKYGKLNWDEVLAPAIELAENGFILDYKTTDAINYYNNEFSKIPASKKIFTDNGEPIKENELFVQKDLATTLYKISKFGAETFYTGEIAQLFLNQSKINGGIFTEEDFKLYKAVERRPLKSQYKNFEILSVGPPSSGGIAVAQTLNVLENFNLEKKDWGSSNYIHLLTEIFKRVYSDRSKHLGDSDFYSVPIDYLTSKEYAKKIFDDIDDSAKPSALINPVEINISESEETTHYSVADNYGNVVSTTYTINASFGNKIVVEGLGFLLNNEMDDFSAKPGEPNLFGLIGSEANSIQPQKRMLSSMTPSIVLNNGKPILVVGSPGGSTIITSVIQVILNVIEFDMSIRDAVSLPRFHHQWLPDKLILEKYGFSEDAKNNLRARGHQFGNETSLGRVEAILIDQNKKHFYGISDPRGNGKAVGY
jgi:gamma-glutamyltranspeptidase/glutathione hydrolase